MTRNRKTNKRPLYSPGAVRSKYYKENPYSSSDAIRVANIFSALNNRRTEYNDDEDYERRKKEAEKRAKDRAKDSSTVKKDSIKVRPDTLPAKPNASDFTLDTVLAKRDSIAKPVKPEEPVKPKEKSAPYPTLMANLIEQAGLKPKETKIPYLYEPNNWLDTMFDIPESKTKSLSLADQQQYKDGLEYINREADKMYNNRISEARRNLEHAQELYDRTLESSVGYSTTYNEIAKPKIDLAKRNLDASKKEYDKLVHEKDQVIQTFMNYVDPASLSENLLVNVAKDSPAYVAKKSIENIAYRLLQNAYQSGDKAKIRKALSDWHQQKDKTRLAEQKITELAQWIGVNGLPDNINQIPSQLQYTASKVFATIDGHNKLDDNDFKDRFRASSVLFKNEFKGVLDETLNSVLNESQNVDYDNAAKKLEESEFMRDYYRDLAKLTKDNAPVHRGISIFLKDSQLDKQQQYDLEANKFQTSVRLYKNALLQREISDLIDSRRDNNKFVRGLQNALTAGRVFFTNANTYFFDLPNLRTASNQYNAYNKLDRGEKLTESDKSILEASLINQQFDQLYGQRINRSDGYRWGQITAESLKFMSEFIATSGMAQGIRYATLKGAKKAIADTLLKKVTKYGSEKVLSAIQKYGTSLVSKTARGVADAVYAAALTNTLGMPKTTLDAYKDVNGQLVGDLDQFGNAQITGTEGRKEFGDAMWLAERRNFAENFSEMLGEFAIGGKLSSATKKLLSKNRKIGDIINRFETNAARGAHRQVVEEAQGIIDSGIQKFGWLKGAYKSILNKKALKNAQFHGFFGETMEEYYGIALNHLMGSQEEQYNKSTGFVEGVGEMFKQMGDESYDIFGGIALSTGLLGAFGIAGHAARLMKYQFAEQKLLNTFGEEGTNIRNKLIFSKANDMMHEVLLLASHYSDDAKKVEALLDYAGRLLSYRGSVFGTEVIRRGTADLYSKAAQQAFDDGFSNASFHTRRIANDVVDIMARRTALTLSIPNTEGKEGDELQDIVDKYIEDNGGVSTIVNQMFDDNKSKNVNEFLSYVNAKRYRDGVGHGLTFMINDQANEEFVRAHDFEYLGEKGDNHTGQIRTIALKDGTIVFPISGEYKVKTGTSDIITHDKSYGKDGFQGILVRMSNGDLVHLNGEELEGAKTQATGSVEDTALRKLTDTIIQLSQQQDKILSKYGTEVGDTFDLGNGKVVTILSMSDGMNGITYSISDENGDNVQIYHDEASSSKDSIIHRAKKELANNITRLFDEQTKRTLLQDAKDSYDAHHKNEQTEESSENETEEEVEPIVSEETSSETPIEETEEEIIQPEPVEETLSEEPEAKPAVVEETTETRELTADEINALDLDDIIKRNAIAYINGTHTGITAETAYLKALIEYNSKHSNQTARVTSSEENNAPIVISDEDERRAEIERKKQEAKAGIKAALNKFINAGKNQLSVSIIGLNNDQITALSDLVVSFAKYGYVLIQEAHLYFDEWSKKMKEDCKDECDVLRSITNWDEEDIDSFLNDVYFDTEISTEFGPLTLDDYAGAVHLGKIAIHPSKLFQLIKIKDKVFTDAEIRFYKKTKNKTSFLNIYFDGEDQWVTITGDKYLEIHCKEGIIHTDYVHPDDLKEPKSSIFDRFFGGLKNILSRKNKEEAEIETQEDETDVDDDEEIIYNPDDFVVHDPADSVEEEVAEEEVVVEETPVEEETIPLKKVIVIPSKDTDDKKASLAKLDGIIERSKAAKNNRRASSYHYFLTIGGKNVLARRLHSVMIDRFRDRSVNKDDVKQQLEFYKMLREYYTQNGIEDIFDEGKIVDQIIKIAINRTGNNIKVSEDNLRQSLNAEEYKKIIAEYPTDTNIHLEILNGISHILAQRDPYFSVAIGNMLDTICRIFFDYKRTKELRYDDENLTFSYLDGVPHHISEHIPGTSTPFITEKVFKEIISQLEDCKKTYDELEWTINTEPVTLYGEFVLNGTGQSVYVAGETDAIAVDQQGKYHLIDFKTYKHSQAKSYHQYSELSAFDTKMYGIDEATNTPHFFMLETPYEQNNRKDDSEDGPAIFSLAAQYSQQLTAYKIMFGQQVGIGNVLSVEVMMMAVGRNPRRIKGIYNTLTSKNTFISIPSDPNNSNSERVANRIVLDQSVLAQYTNQNTEDPVKYIIDLLQAVEDHDWQEFRKEAELHRLPTYSGLPVNLAQQLEDYNNKIDNLIELCKDAKKEDRESLRDRLHEMTEVAHDILDAIDTYNRDQEAARKKAERMRERANKFWDEHEDLDAMLIRETNNLARLHYLFADNAIEDEAEDSERLQKLAQLLFILKTLVEYAAIKGKTFTHRKNLNYFKNIEPQLAAKLQQKGIFYEAMDIDSISVDTNGQKIPTDDSKKHFWNYTTVSSVRGVVAKEDPSVKLDDYSIRRDFINHSNFYIIRNAKNSNGFDLEIEYTDVNTGKTYTFGPMPIWFESKPDENDPDVKTNERTEQSDKFYKALVKEFSAVQNRKRILLNKNIIFRTNGKIQNYTVQHPVIGNLVTTDKQNATVNTPYLYDIEYSSEFGTFCLTSSKFVNGKPVIIATTPSNEEAQFDIQYQYSGHNNTTNPVSGVVVMLQQRQYDEYDTEPSRGLKPVVPINLNYRKMGDDNANLICDILTGRYTNRQVFNANLTLTQDDIDTILSQPFYLEKSVSADGKRTMLETPFTNRYILEHLISYSYGIKDGSREHVHIYVDKKGITHLRGFLAGVNAIQDDGTVRSLDAQFNLSQEEGDDTIGGRKEFVEFISSKVNMNVQETFMKLRLDSNNNMFPRTEFWKFLNNHPELNGSVRFGNSSVVFDIDDISVNADEGKKAISGIGWYIKRGYLSSEFKGFSSALFNFDTSNENYISKEKAPEYKKPKDTNNSNPKRRRAFITQDEEDSSHIPTDEEGARLYYLDEASGTMLPSDSNVWINETSAREHIRQICGDVDVHFEDTILGIASNAPVLGKCYSDAIILSRLATPGVEYHEAFHRVVELLISEKRREKAYNDYRKAYSKLNGTRYFDPGKLLTDIEVAEGLANNFMDFAQNYENSKINWSFSVVKMYKEISKWIKFYRSIGSFGLYRLYSAAYKGKFANVKPNQKAIDRFNELAKNNDGALHFEHNGVEIESIRNLHEYNVLKKSLLAILTHSQTLTINLNALKIAPSTDINVMLKSGRVSWILESNWLDLRTKLILMDVLELEKDEEGLPIIKPVYKVVDDKETDQVLYHTYVRKPGAKIWEAIRPDLQAALRDYNFKPSSAFERAERDKTLKEQNEEYERGEDEELDDVLITEDPINSGDEAAKQSLNKDEFEPFIKASERVKAFFSGIPIMIKRNTSSKGNVVSDLSIWTNELGFPQNYDVKEAWAIALKRLSNVRNPQELITRIHKYAEEDPFFSLIEMRLAEVVRKAYNFDVLSSAPTKSDKSALGTVNLNDAASIKDADAFGKFAEIYCAIKAADVDKRVANAITLESMSSANDTGDDAKKKGSVAFMSANRQYQSKDLMQMWSDAISSGETKYFSLSKNGQYKEKLTDVATRLKNIASYMIKLPDILSGKVQPSFTVNVEYVKYNRDLNTYQKHEDPINHFDKDNDVHLDALKQWFILHLNDVGIMISMSDFDHTLDYYFGKHDAEAFKDFLTRRASKQNSVIDQFANTLSKLSPTTKFSHIWSADANPCELVRRLATGKYDHEMNTVQLSVITVNGKKLYVISENNFITDRLDDLQETDSNGKNVSETLNHLKNDPYFLTSEDVAGEVTYSGSRALQYILSNKINSDDESIATAKRRLKFVAYSGFKTDEKGNIGIEYTSQSPIEDYAARYAMLANNMIVLPTIADKTTYGGIEGMDAFGFDYFRPRNATNIYRNRVGNKQLNRIGLNDGLSVSAYSSSFDYAYIDQDGTITNNNLHVRFPRYVIKQFIDYAKCELRSAEINLERHQKLLEQEQERLMVENIDGKRDPQTLKYKGPIQSARFSRFTGVICTEDIVEDVIEHGQTVQKVIYRAGEFINFNNSKLSEQECIDLAKKYFFDLENNDSTKEKQYELMERLLSYQTQRELEALLENLIIEIDEKGFYKNTALDKNKIAALESFLYWNIHQDKEDQTRAVSTAQYDASTSGQKHSNAIIAYIADMSIKHLMSIEEVSKLFTGNLAANKWKYDKEGNCVDSTTDFFKRVGGLGSTGTNNFSIIPGESNEFTCAEVEDDNGVESELVTWFEENAIKQDIRSAVVAKKMRTSPYGDILSYGFIDSSDENKALFNNFLKLVNSEVDSMSFDEQKTFIGKSEADNIIKTAKEKADKLRKNSDGEGINVNDGATYITDIMAEKLLIRRGAYNDAIREAFKILRGETSTMDGVLSIADAYNQVRLAVLGSQKYTGFGQRATKFTSSDGHTYTINTTFFDKTSYIPLFKCMATGPLGYLYDIMVDPKRGVDVLKMHSGTKIGSQGAQIVSSDTFKQWSESVKKGDTSAIDNFTFENHRYVQSFDSIRRLFNTDPKEGHHEMSFGSQMKKVVFSPITPDLVINVNGEAYTATEIRDQYMDCLKNLSNLGKSKFEKKFFNFDERGNRTSLNEAAFARELRKQLSSRDANTELLTATEIVEEGGEKHMKCPLGALSSTNWIQSIVSSMIGKDVIDIKSPGAAFYQRPVWGMEGDSRPVIVNERNVMFNINNGKKLSIKNEDNSMDIVLSIDFFDFLFEKHPHLKNQSFLAKKQWLINNGLISGMTYKKSSEGKYINLDGGYVLYDPTNKVHNDRAVKDETGHIVFYDQDEWVNANTNIVGYRIPTQAVSSIHAMRCVDVVPAIVHTIIMPAEVTAVTGSDFDIDKFFLNTMFYQDEISDEEEEKTHSEKRQSKTITNEFEEGSYEYYVNKLVTLQIAILKSKDNNVGMLLGAIDKDTEPLIDCAKELRDANNREMPFDNASLRLNIRVKQLFATGKTGIGPFALNNNSHILAMLYGVKFKDVKGSTLSELGLTDLSQPVDRHGHSISSWLSGLINAHVDVAKDPYISYLGVNKYTYNLVNLLIRTGYGKETFWFTTQPVMKQFYKAFNVASGVYMQDNTLSQMTRQQEAVDKVFCQYISEGLSEYKLDQVSVEYRGEAISQFLNYLKERYYVGLNADLTYNDLLKTVIKSQEGVEVLHQLSTHSVAEMKDKTFTFNVYGYDDKKITLTFFDIQGIVACTNFELLKNAKDLSDMVKYTKIDTKKHGKTIIEQDAYRKGLNRLMDPKRSPFTKEFANMVNDSFIRQTTDNAIDLMTDLLGQQLIQGTSMFAEQVKQVESAIAYGDTSANVERTKAISKMINAKVKSRFFFGSSPTDDSYCKTRGIDPVKLFIGESSIYDLLNRIKHGITNKANRNYDWLRGEDGLSNNYLIRCLINDTIVEEGKINTMLIPDEWSGAKFIKNRNIFDDSVKSDEIASAWADLLNDSEHYEIQRFAEELVVYAFMTSVDSGGKFDLFKYVPIDWRLGTASCFDTDALDQTYLDFSLQMLNAYNSSTDESVDPLIDLTDADIDDMILNFYHDDNIIRPVSVSKLNRGICINSANNGTGDILLFGAINNNNFIFSETEYPKYFKVVREGKFTGQSKYNVYRYIGEGVKYVKQQDDIKTRRYPIYELVHVSGGMYTGGQTIYSIGNSEVIQKTKYFSRFKNLAGQIFSTFQVTFDRSTGSKMLSPGDLLNSFVYTVEETGDYTIQPRGNVLGINMLKMEVLASDFYRAQSTNENADLYDVEERYNQSTKQNNAYRNNTTNLNLHKIDSRYTKTKLSDFPQNHPFDVSRIAALKTYGISHIHVYDNASSNAIKETGSRLHFEYYEKKWKDGKGSNYVITVSIPREKNKGFFELVADTDEDGNFNNTFSVHFKTKSSKAKNDSEFASVPLTKYDKLLLTQGLLYLVPEGGKIRTHGSISRGGAHLLSTLNTYATSRIARSTKMQYGTGLLVESSGPAIEYDLKGSDEKVSIPVWVKDTKQGEFEIKASKAQQKTNKSKKIQPLKNVVVKNRPGMMFDISEASMASLIDTVFKGNTGDFTRDLLYARLMAISYKSDSEWLDAILYIRQLDETDLDKDKVEQFISTLEMLKSSKELLDNSCGTA